eukprot:5731453-Prymnesium_polylepis.1
MAAAKVGATIAPKAPENNTSYVVTQSEEERAFSLPTYTIEEATKQRAVLVKLHNLRVRPFLTPSYTPKRYVRARTNVPQIRPSYLKLGMCASYHI